MRDQSELLKSIPSRPLDAHKWQSACWVIAGSPGMEGAAILSARAAQRSGAGYVRLSIPNAEFVEAPLEVVVTRIEKDLQVEDEERFASLVLGPGIGSDPLVMKGVRRLLQKTRTPVIIDGDGLKALRNFSFKKEVSASTVLTPHDGEFESITGKKVTKDREQSALRLAETVGAVVLLKGPTTVVASSEGQIEKIKAGELNFEKLICTPSMMIKLSKLGKVLGPKGLMPNPKLGSVSNDIKQSVINAKSGQVEIRNDKDGNIGLSIGKKNFSDDKLIKNFNAIFEVLEKEKGNNTIKGNLIKNAYLTSTMGVSYKIKLPKNI